MPTDTIEAEESEYLYVKPSQIEQAGKGLYTAIDIYKYEVISLFKGETISNKEANKRAELGVDKYFINLLNGKIMDSMHTECFAKYANDSRGSKNSAFKNNAEITIDEDNNVCLQATKKIKSGEEVFCGYGKEYWKRHG
jgi:hypothetical protein